MKRQKRPFYIIAHNANTIEEAKEFFDAGANALEPDIVYANQQFYVSHTDHLSYNDVPTLEDYLKQLKELILEEGYNVALLIFDMKDTDFDPNHLVSVIKQNFSDGVCDGIALLLTHGDDYEFVNRYCGNYPNVGIGVDESNTPPSELEAIFKKAGQKNFSYADGITTFLTKPGVYENITKAQSCRDENEPDSFKLIYTWVLSLEGSMRKYLDTYIDGIFVDTAEVEKLKELVSTAPYNEAFELASNGYNPFTASPIPKYKLTIKTKDKKLAGTDARIVFTLTGTSGQSLKSLPYNGNLPGALERESITTVTIEGMHLGSIQSLTVEAMNEDINSDWLPEYITVESKLLDKPLKFVFNDANTTGEWVTKKGGAVTKLPSNQE